MSITIDVSEEIAAAIQASPDGMERARHLLESEFGDEMYVDPAEGEDREDLIAKVNAALADPDPLTFAKRTTNSFTLSIGIHPVQPFCARRR